MRLTGEGGREGGKERERKRERERGSEGMLLLLLQVPGTQLFDHFILATKEPPPFILFPLSKTYKHTLTLTLTRTQN